MKTNIDYMKLFELLNELKKKYPALEGIGVSVDAIIFTMGLFGYRQTVWISIESIRDAKIDIVEIQLNNILGELESFAYETHRRN